MSEELEVSQTYAVGDTACTHDVVFKDPVTHAAVNITGFVPKLRARGKRQAAALTDIVGVLQDAVNGRARFDLVTLTAAADFYRCQPFLVDGSSKIQTAQRDFAVVVRDKP